MITAGSSAIYFQLFFYSSVFSASFFLLWHCSWPGCQLVNSRLLCSSWIVKSHIDGLWYFGIQAEGACVSDTFGVALQLCVCRSFEVFNKKFHCSSAGYHPDSSNPIVVGGPQHVGGMQPNMSMGGGMPYGGGGGMPSQFSSPISQGPTSGILLYHKSRISSMVSFLLGTFENSVNVCVWKPVPSLDCRAGIAWVVAVPYSDKVTCVWVTSQQINVFQKNFHSTIIVNKILHWETWTQGFQILTNAEAL